MNELFLIPPPDGLDDPEEIEAMDGPMDAWDEPDYPKEDPGVWFSTVKIVRETPKAILCEIPQRGQHWIPKSQLLEGAQKAALLRERSGTLAISTWLANERNIGPDFVDDSESERDECSRTNDDIPF